MNYISILIESLFWQRKRGGSLWQTNGNEWEIDMEEGRIETFEVDEEGGGKGLSPPLSPSDFEVKGVGKISRMRILQSTFDYAEECEADLPFDVIRVLILEPGEGKVKLKKEGNKQKEKKGAQQQEER